MAPLHARGLLPALAVCIALVAAVTAAGQTTTEPTTTDPTTTDPVETEPGPTEAQRQRALTDLRRYRRQTVIFFAVMGRRVPPVPRTRAEFVETYEFHVWLRRLWIYRARRARALAYRPPHLRAWLCIHRHEGPWTDPNAPYYGGLQMDLAFQRRYAPRILRRKGTADRWTPLEQMWVAERAVRDGRWFHPWPVTARRCGLI